jgi:hypothetical protein
MITLQEFKQGLGHKYEEARGTISKESLGNLMEQNHLWNSAIQYSPFQSTVTEALEHLKRALEKDNWFQGRIYLCRLTDSCKPHTTAYF